MPTEKTRATAWLGHRFASRLRDVTSDISALDSSGWWAVSVTYEGQVTCARFDDVSANIEPRELARLTAGSSWVAPEPQSWHSSMSKDEYQDAIEVVRGRIATGDFYQANICRLLQAKLPSPASGASVAALARFCANENPAPFEGYLEIPDIAQPVRVATSSPELFLRRAGRQVSTAPIKGTASHRDGFTAKDQAENIMIVDLMRNDFGRICDAGSVSATRLLEVEEHPGLFHLVSHVDGQLQANVSWAEIFDAVFPPGSVTGAPKIAAMSAIVDVEPVARGPYCGVIGWVDADAHEAELAVGIRTFFITDDVVSFGTGAGITYASNAAAEWAETELKSARLISIASQASAAA